MSLCQVSPRSFSCNYGYMLPGRTCNGSLCLKCVERLWSWFSGQRAGHGAGRWCGGARWLHWGQVCGIDSTPKKKPHKNSCNTFLKYFSLLPMFQVLQSSLRVRTKQFQPKNSLTFPLRSIFHLMFSFLLPHPKLVSPITLRIWRFLISWLWTFWLPSWRFNLLC